MYKGNLEVLQMLLSVNMEDLGLPLNAIGGTWTSPLCEAIDVGHVATVRLLIDSRTTVNSPSPAVNLRSYWPFVEATTQS